MAKKRKTKSHKVTSPIHLIWCGFVIVFILALIVGRNIGFNFGSLFGKGEVNSTTTNHTGGDVKANDQGASTGDNGVIIQTHGDNSPVHNETIICSNLTINCSTYNRMGLGLFANTSTGENLRERFVDDAEVCQQQERIFLDAINSMDAGYKAHDWEQVIDSSWEAKNAAEKLYQNGNMSDAVRAALPKGVEEICDVAFSREQFSRVIDFIDSSLPYLTPPPPVRLKAFRKAAELRKAGQFLYFPENKELVEMRKVDVDYVYEYLNTLARWGMLQPRKINVIEGAVEKCSYGDYFGFTEELDYQSVFHVREFDTECQQFVVREMSKAFAGFDRTVTFCITTCYELAMGGPIKKNVPLKEKFDMPIVDDQYIAMLNKAPSKCFADEASDPSVCYVNPRLSELGEELRDGNAGLMKDVPEPTSGLLMLLGMAGLALRRRRA